MKSSCDAIVIGSSLGGMSALNTILSALPADFQVPIMIVQHQLASAEEYLIEYLNKNSPVNVKHPFPGEKIEPSNAYIAPPGYHLLVEENGTLSLSIDLPVNYSIPSIDVLFESAADAYQERLIGIVLTGASADGAQGLRAIKNLGGLTIVQDPSTAEADTMPKAAIAATEINHVVPLTEIADLIRSVCND